jgi:hypothetical protein
VDAHQDGAHRDVRRLFLHGWRRGDLIVGLGFPRRDLVQNPGDDVAEARTVYEVFITYSPKS